VEFMDDESKRLAQTAASVLGALAQAKGLPESLSLKKKFRCPHDGSTNVQKISGILNAATTSLLLDGKTVPIVVNNAHLKRYRPGNRPMKPYFLLSIAPFAIFLGVALAVIFPGMQGSLFLLLMALLGFGAIWLFIQESRNLAGAISEWERKVQIAERHWHCHTCDEHFDPNSPDSIRDIKCHDDDANGDGENGTALNVRPLRSE
jgi:hypothetical protein